MFSTAKKVDIVDFQKEAKRRERKQKIADAYQTVKDFVDDKKEEIAFWTPIIGLVVPGATYLTKQVISNHKANKEIDFKERHIYDRSLGRYVELKKKLTPAQAISIEERRANGEKLNTILDSMGLLKH